MPFDWWGRIRKKSLGKEARRHLRTAVTLHCQIELENGDRGKGDVLDLTVQGAQIRMAFEHLDAIALDQKVSLTIEGPKQGWSVQTRALVRHLRSDRGVWSYVGLEFMDVGTLYSQLENALSTYFNRRASKRVSMLKESGFSAKIKHGRAIETARISDLSLGGVSVLMNTFQSVAFTTGSTAELRLILPGTKDELAGRVIVRHRQSERGVERLGLEFDHESPMGFARHSAAIERYFKRLQRLLDKAKRARIA